MNEFIFLLGEKSYNEAHEDPISQQKLSLSTPLELTLSMFLLQPFND